MKLSEMQKDMKIKHSVSSVPPTAMYRRTFFRKKALHGRTNSFGQIYGEMFYIGINNKTMEGEKSMVKSFQRLSQVSFPLIDPDLSY